MNQIGGLFVTLIPGQFCPAPQGQIMAQTETSQSLQADRRFVKSAMSVPLLEAGHERDLARRWREQTMRPPCTN